MMTIQKRKWGSCGGKDVFLLELDGGCGLRARISNYGGVLQALLVENARGEMLDVVLGYDTLEEYVRSETFFGAMIGPVADRLGGGRCTLGDVEVQLPLNAGPDCMHSGPNGFHAQVWDWFTFSNGISLRRSFTAADNGFPGNVNVFMMYKIVGKTLRIEYLATVTGHETAASFTNHSYFNLDGGKNDCNRHRISVYADRYAETERETDPICTGRALPVQNTPMDLRKGALLEDVLARNDFHEIRTGGGLDHYFLTNGGGMRQHACVESAASGLRMRCFSDAPGVLVYSGNGLVSEAGKDGAVYGRNYGICLETEKFPNSMNRPFARESIILRPREKYLSATEFHFENI